MTATVSDRIESRPARVDGGSFRDRQGRVFYSDGRVCRGLRPEASAAWRELKTARFFRDALASGAIVGTEDGRATLAGPLAAAEGWDAVLVHETIPFVSYPYEWTFGQLKDAALLQLSLLEAATAEGWVLSDGTPYNVQWRGARPTFIDVASFRHLDPVWLWRGYQQFCRQQLYPLMLLALKGVPFQPWLRGSLEGIAGEDLARLFSWRDAFRPGVVPNLWLANAAARHGGKARGTAAANCSADEAALLVRSMARRLAGVVRQLTWEPPPSAWSDYGSRSHYERAELEVKADIVADVLGRRRWPLVWDLGSNDAYFSRMAARNADCVVALEGDHATVEASYRRLKADGVPNIVPLLMDLANPSSGMGWNGAERAALTGRAKPDLVLALAVIHHMVIGANVRLDEYVRWLRSLDATVILEFPTRDDPMVQHLLSTREDVFSDYHQHVLERYLNDLFHVSCQKVINRTRIMYVLHAKS